jgi:hypothetical protein
MLTAAPAATQATRLYQKEGYVTKIGARREQVVSILLKF